MPDAAASLQAFSQVVAVVALALAKPHHSVRHNEKGQIVRTQRRTLECLGGYHILPLLTGDY